MGVKMASRRSAKLPPKSDTESTGSEIGKVRIIGGSLRGRTLEFPTAPQMRPMKDRVREALFNLLGPSIRNTRVIDLFAGTGALGFEAISRGAVHATFIERHVPTARLLRDNARRLQLETSTEVINSDTFVWWKRHPVLANEPTIVFCSPPYELYQSRTADLMQLLAGLMHQLVPGSRLAVEFDERFSAPQLPNSDDWDVRAYAGIFLAIYVCSADGDARDAGEDVRDAGGT
ncbi:MAG: Ribosomal small subunit methyltransferase [Planctomycetota bacterium]